MFLSLWGPSRAGLCQRQDRKRIKQHLYLHLLPIPGTVKINISCLSLPTVLFPSWPRQLGSSDWGLVPPLVDAPSVGSAVLPDRSILPPSALKREDMRVRWPFVWQWTLQKSTQTWSLIWRLWKFLSTVSQVLTHARVKQPHSWSHRSLGILCFANMFTRAATLF